MSKATESELSALHGVVARGLRDVIEAKGEDGAVAPASYFMAALAMLKQNNITADPDQNSDLKALADRLSEKRQKAKSNLIARSAILDEAADQFEQQLTGLLK